MSKYVITKEFIFEIEYVVPYPYPGPNTPPIGNLKLGCNLRVVKMRPNYDIKENKKGYESWRHKGGNKWHDKIMFDMDDLYELDSDEAALLVEELL